MTNKIKINTPYIELDSFLKFANVCMSGGEAKLLIQAGEVKLNGEEITLSSARNLAYDASQEVRKAAYEAELKAYDSVKDAVAFALNSIKLQVLSECEL